MDLVKPEKAIFGHVARKIESISDDFVVIEAENKRLRAHKTLLEGQLELERTKVNDLRTAFGRIEATMSLRDAQVAQLCHKLLTANGNRLVSVNPTLHVQGEAEAIADHDESSPLVTQNAAKIGTDLFVQHSQNCQSQVDSLVAFLNDWSRQKLGLVDDLVQLIHRESSAHLAKLESLSAYVQQFIVLLREFEYTQSSQGRLSSGQKSSDRLFDSNLGGLSPGFFKTHAKTTLEENKFLVFCLEQIKQKLETSKVDFPMHLLESEFLMRHRERIVADNPNLFATVEQLMEANLALRKQVYVDSERRAFGKRVKTEVNGKIEDIEKGLVFLGQEARDDVGLLRAEMDRKVADHFQAVEASAVASAERAAEMQAEILRLQEVILQTQNSEQVFKSAVETLKSEKQSLAESFERLKCEFEDLKRRHERKEDSDRIVGELEAFMRLSSNHFVQENDGSSRAVIDKAIAQLSDANRTIEELGEINRKLTAQIAAKTASEDPDSNNDQEMEVEDQNKANESVDSAPNHQQSLPKTASKESLAKMRKILGQISQNLMLLEQNTQLSVSKLLGIQLKLQKVKESQQGLEKKIESSQAPSISALTEVKAELESVRLARDHLFTHMQRYAKFG